MRTLPLHGLAGRLRPMILAAVIASVPCAVRAQDAASVSALFGAEALRPTGGLAQPATEPVEPAASQPSPSGGSSTWRPALAASFRLLLIEHGSRLLQSNVRERLRGPFASDYRRSLRVPRTWEDSDHWTVNYLGHPVHGAAAARAWLDHLPDDRAHSTQFSSKRYWADRAVATAWAAGYSVQFEFGPLSEASIGNVGLDPRTSGWVDHVVTPVGALAMTVAEDALDRYFIARVERHTGNRVFRVVLRTLFNPSRSLAQLAEGHVPWARHGRPLR